MRRFHSKILSWAQLACQCRLAANAWTNRSNLKTGDWVCTRCGFVSANGQHRCSDCRAVRSDHCFLINQMACLHCKVVNHAGNPVCFSCQRPLNKSLLLSLAGGGGSGGAASAKATGRLQRPEDVRVVKNWKCLYCATMNLHQQAICLRCKKIRSHAR